MKKYFLSGAIIITVALAGWNISKNNSEKGMSDIALANVEALAQYELPEFGITCGSSGGVCWINNGICFSGEYTYNKCTFVGSTMTRCSSGC
ncbi:MAG: NVEALA domain-containing protein [Tannerellaceae bacterium]|jgi:hypothetical protein|nr:NVEALA domain-containing protein [Tannerellaceae bacterium]